MNIIEVIATNTRYATAVRPYLNHSNIPIETDYNQSPNIRTIKAQSAKSPSGCHRKGGTHQVRLGSVIVVQEKGPETSESKHQRSLHAVRKTSRGPTLHEGCKQAYLGGQEVYRKRASSNCIDSLTMLTGATVEHMSQGS